MSEEREMTQMERALAILRFHRKDQKMVAAMWHRMYPLEKTAREVIDAVTVPIPYVVMVGFVLLMEAAFKEHGLPSDNQEEPNDKQTIPPTPATGDSETGK